MTSPTTFTILYIHIHRQTDRSHINHFNSQEKLNVTDFQWINIELSEIVGYQVTHYSQSSAYPDICPSVTDSEPRPSFPVPPLHFRLGYSSVILSDFLRQKKFISLFPFCLIFFQLD